MAAFRSRLISGNRHGSGFTIEVQGLQGLYVVGADAHPGAGLPGVVSSAKTLDHLVPEPVAVL